MFQSMNQAKATWQGSLTGRIFFSPPVYRMVRIALGLVFVAAGALKLADPGAFAEIIARYGLVPLSMVPAVAVVLPALEVAAGLGIMFEVRLSLASITAMLIMFAVVLWYGALAGLDIDCGCFSAAEQAEHDSLRSALYRDLLMLVGVVYLYLWRWTRRPACIPSGWRYIWI